MQVETFDDLKTNPAKRLVQLALNRWAYKNLRADNTSVILVMVDQESDNDLNLSRTNSDISCASTIKLADADVFTDLDVNVRGNIKIETDENNSAKPNLTHNKLCQHFPNRSNTAEGKRAHRIVCHIHTPDSAQVRCFPERWRRLHKNHSRKYRSHLFWGRASSSVGLHDKIIIPTKYKATEEAATVSIVDEKLISHISSGSQSKKKDNQVIDPGVLPDQTGPSEPGEAPGEISMANPREDELPELNKIIIPSKYKVLDVECGSDIPLNSKKSHLLSEVGGDCNLSRLSSLRGSQHTVIKRKMSDMDMTTVAIKKPKRWIANAQNTEPVTVNSKPAFDGLLSVKGGCDDPVFSDNAKLAVSARSPLKVNTYHEELPSTAIISPIWPNSLENEANPGVDNTLCTAYPLSGKQDCCSIIHKGFPEKAQHGLHFPKKSSGVKSQEVRVTTKRLHFRNKRIKLGNMRHRTRLQVRTRFTRKY